MEINVDDVGLICGIFIYFLTGIVVMEFVC